MVLKVSPKNLDQSQHYTLLYIVLSGSTLEWHVPCVPSCLKFTYVTTFSLHLTHVLQFYSTTLVYFFVSYLWPIGSVSIFILCDFTTKIPVHRESNPDNCYPSEHVSDIHPHFVFCSHNFMILSSLAISCSFATYFVHLPLTSPHM